MVKEYGYEYDTVLDKKIYEQTKGKVTRESFMGALCLRSGRDALKVVAREYKSTVVLIPSLACESMIHPFRMYGHRIKYYKLNNDYSVNLESIYSQITNEDKVVLFLYMDYFGNNSIGDTELEVLRAKYPALVFIEDRTHTLFVENRKKFKPDFIIASLRKWIDIPDGGLLWTDKKLKENRYSEDLTFSEVRLHAQCLRKKFLISGDENLKIKYRKIFSTVANTIDEDLLPGLMSRYAYHRACNVNLKNINNARLRNAQVLLEELKGFDFVQKEAGLGDVYVAILIRNRDDVQRKLSSKGIFCTVIWPLNREQRETCKVAKYTEEHMLAIYCDQRYTIEDMKYIASCIRRVCNE